MKRLVEDFETTRRAYPEWNCPEVRICEKGTLDEMAVIEGGPGVYPPDSDADD